MFEKEAEEYLKKDGTKAEKILNMLNEISPLSITLKQVPFILAMLKQIFQDGAEFGFNKANEWHYVKDELPELYKDVLVVFPQGDCDVKHLTNHNEWVGRGPHFKALHFHHTRKDILVRPRVCIPSKP